MNRNMNTNRNMNMNRNMSNMNTIMSNYQRKQRPFICQDVNDSMALYPLPNDVIVEADMNTTHNGNIYLLQLLIAEKDEYTEEWESTCTVFYAKMAQRVFSKIASQDPPGRFLKRNEETNEWEGLGLEDAMKAILFYSSKVMLQVDSKEKVSQLQQQQEEDVAAVVAAVAARVKAAPQPFPFAISRKPPPSLLPKNKQRHTWNRIQGQIQNFIITGESKWDNHDFTPRRRNITGESKQDSYDFTPRWRKHCQTPEVIDVDSEEEIKKTPAIPEAEITEIDYRKRSSELTDMNSFLNNQIESMSVLSIRAAQQMLQHKSEYENAEEYLRLLEDYKRRLERFKTGPQKLMRADATEQKFVQEMRSEFGIAVNELMRKQKAQSQKMQQTYRDDLQKIQNLQKPNGHQDRQRQVNGVERPLPRQQPVPQQHKQEKEHTQIQQTMEQQRLQLQQTIRMQQNQIRLLQQNQQVMMKMVIQSQRRESIHSTVVVNPQFNLPEQRRGQDDQGVQNVRQMPEDEEPRDKESREPRKALSKRSKTHEQEGQQPKRKKSKKTAVVPDLQVSNEEQRFDAKNIATNKQQNESGGYDSDDSDESLVF